MYPSPPSIRRAACVWSVVALLLALAAGCARTPPEQALRDQIAALQAAIEDRDARAVRESLAEDFIGEAGLDREGARRLAAVYFLRNAQIGMTIGPLDIALQDEHATVGCTVVLTGGSGGLLPESGRLYNVETGWRLHGDEWRMTSATWSADR